MVLALVNTKSNVSDGTLQKHIKFVTAARELLDTANSDYRTALKAAKSDGINQKQLLAALQSKKRDIDAVRLDLRDYVRYLGLCSMAMTQQDLFGNADRNSPPAGQAGLSAGKAGRDRQDNPHTLGTEPQVAWDKGWIKGQKTIAKQMGPKAKVASTRRKRGPAPGLPFDA
jgi:hypothetical protein